MFRSEQLENPFILYQDLQVVVIDTVRELGVRNACIRRQKTFLMSDYVGFLEFLFSPDFSTDATLLVHNWEVAHAAYAQF